MLSRYGRLRNVQKHGRTCRRSMASRSSYNFQTADPSRIRNMAVVAHIDSGKTTLTESILHASSYIKSPGSVDTGSTITDFLPAERERGITIQSASIPVQWKKWTFNLIDTPGHADFGMEVESASRVVDGAVVVVDSVQGVEPQTKAVWKQLDKYNVRSRILFMNKLDRAGASFRSSFLSLLSNRLHARPVILSLPIASFNVLDYSHAEPGIAGLVDIVRWEVWCWHNGTFSRQRLPVDIHELNQSSIFPPGHPVLQELIPARIRLLETISMTSDTLLDSLVALPSENSWIKVPGDEVLPHLRLATLKGEVLPVMCGSAMNHVGTELLLDYVGELLANPSEASLPIQSAKEQTQLLAWKVSWDKRRGWMTFVRVYSGTLRARQSLMNVNRNQRERPAKLLLLHANHETEVESLPFGSVGVVLGLKHTRTGDTLCTGPSKLDSCLPDITPPASVLSSSLIPMSHSEEQPLYDAVQALTRTDPSVRAETSNGQLLVHCLGPLHLEIVANRLKDEWGAQFEVGSRRVAFCETVADDSTISSHEVWTTDVNGTSVSVVVRLKIAKLDDTFESGAGSGWGGNAIFYNDKPLTSPEASTQLGIPAIEQALSRGVYNALSTSPTAHLPLTNLAVTVQHIEIPCDAPLNCVTGAATFVIRKAIHSAGMGPLMEPYVQLKVEVDEQHIGPVMRDLIERGGEIQDFEGPSANSVEGMPPFVSDGLYVPPEILTPCSGSSNAAFSAKPKSRKVVCAHAPLVKVLDYSHRLRAITGGQGIYDSLNIGYTVVGELRKLEILKEIGRF